MLNSSQVTHLIIEHENFQSIYPTARAQEESERFQSDRVFINLTGSTRQFKVACILA